MPILYFYWVKLSCISFSALFNTFYCFNAQLEVNFEHILAVNT